MIALRRLLHPLLDFALPPRCPGCGAVVDGDHRFCHACWSSLRWLDGRGCARCHAPIEDLGEDAVCATCLERPPRHDGVRAAVAYGPIAARVAMRLKYGRKPGVATVMARAMERHVNPEERPLLVAVPLHRWRIWSRGFNQSALIASRLAGLRGVEAAPDVLVRLRPTPPLRGLGRAARMRTLKGAIGVSPAGRDRVRGRPVLLVDDVYTSGATAETCAAALKRAGAARVTVLCCARVLPGDSEE